MKLSQAVELFLTGVRADGLSDQTRVWYQYCLCRLVRYLGDPSLDAITADDLRRFVADLREKNLRWSDHKFRKPLSGGFSPSTLQGYVRSIKRLFSWLEENEHIAIDQNPAVRLKKPKLPAPQPKEISIENIRALLKIAQHSKPFPKRDYALILFLADTGCRAGGLVSLRLGDLDLKNNQAFVTEKGRKRRYLFLSDVTKAALKKWLVVRPDQTDFVFVSARGQMTIWGVHQLLARLKKAAGIEGRVNPHAFRHSFAKRYLNNGGDLATLADMLGHTDVMVTKRFYSVFTSEELKRKHKQHNPLAGIVGK